MTKHLYRVRQGFEYGANGEYKSGAIVELDESDAKYEMDKLELAEAIPAPESLLEKMEKAKQEEDKKEPEPPIAPPTEPSPESEPAPAEKVRARRSSG